MREERNLLKRLREEARRAYEATDRTARRVARQGVLEIDLVSLRRGRGRALGHLGERALKLWSADSPDTIFADSEALRLKSLVEDIEASIRAKEAELQALRRAASAPRTGSPSSGADSSGVDPERSAAEDRESPDAGAPERNATTLP